MQPEQVPRTRASPLVAAAVEPTAADYLLDAVLSLDDGFFVLDQNWQYVFVNPAGYRLLDRLPDDVIGRSLWTVMPELRGTSFEREYRLAMRGRRTRRFEAHFEPYDAWFKIHAYPSGNHLAIIARDVTEERRVRKALVETEARHLAILKAVPDLLLWINPDGRTLASDLQAEHPLLCQTCVHAGIRGLVRCHVDELLSPVVAQSVLDTVRRVIRSGEPEEVDFQISLATADAHVFEGRIVPIAGESAALMVIRDVTERRRLENEVLRISEDVRQEIGRDLHDGLGSHLTGVAMIARRLARDVSRGVAAGSADLEEVGALIADGIEQARLLARGLNPIGIESEGLCGSLAGLVRSMGSADGPRCVLGTTAADGVCACPSGFPELDPQTATHLFRIAQEAVHNAVRHSGGNDVCIDLQVRGGTLELSVSDDGRGFGDDVEPGMGIRVMRYRARLIGANLEIARSHAGGTVVKCILPFDTSVALVEHALPNKESSVPPRLAECHGSQDLRR